MNKAFGYSTTQIFPEHINANIWALMEQLAIRNKYIHVYIFGFERTLDTKHLGYETSCTLIKATTLIYRKPRIYRSLMKTANALIKLASRQSDPNFLWPLI